MHHNPSWAGFTATARAAACRFMAVATLAVGLIAPIPSSAAEQPQVDPEIYKIAPLDVLEVAVYGQQQLSRTAPVRPDGRFQVAFGEVVRAAGRTPMELARLIEQRLAEYIENPRVEVYVQQGVGAYDQRIRVIGGGVDPTTVPYARGMTLVDLVSRIGGLPQRADGNDAILLRREDGVTRQIPVRLDDLIDDGDIAANRQLAPGDVIVVPEGFFAGDWQFQQGARSEVTYTDNIDLAPEGEEDDALIFRSGPTVSIRGDAARISGGIDAALLGRTETLSDEDTSPEIDVDLGATGNLEAVPDLVFVDASASVSRLLTDGGEAQSASGANVTNRETFQTYRISPYVVNRLGSFARMRTRYSATQTVSGGDAASDSLTHEGTVTLQDGRSFGQLGWTVDGLVSEEVRADATDVSRRRGRLSLTYPVFDRLEAIARAGYETFEESGDNGAAGIDRADPFWSIGLRWQPSPATSLRAEVGQRFGGETFALDAEHEVSERTLIFARYNETVSTQQGRLGSNLPRRADDLDGARSRQNPFDINDTVTTTETLEVGARTRIGSNRLGLQGVYTTQSQGIDVGEDSDEQVLGIDLSWQRPLGPDWRFDSGLNYEHRTSDLVRGTTDDMLASASVSYDGFRWISLDLRYDFSRRFADQPDDEFTENAVTFRARIDF